MGDSSSKNKTMNKHTPPAPSSQGLGESPKLRDTPDPTGRLLLLNLPTEVLIIICKYVGDPVHLSQNVCSGFLFLFLFLFFLLPTIDNI